jgi:hypothetical protein
MAKKSRGKEAVDSAVNGNGSVPERANTQSSKMARNGDTADKTRAANGKGNGKEEKTKGGLLKWLFKRNVVA